ncbi:hypothetical protein OSB04_014611 [Centaurea solstitialis]|uniref:Cytochrome P450 n=1 Tax=Centaurea solstitialis TaxID=347529 RepID=A0AA38WJC0_9ASTR|nr:hypothetical protein OSB04_014611 [Centaurea solstitialis]
MLPFILSLLLVLIGISFGTTHLRRKKLPPGPLPLPIIGSIHLLGKLPHRVLRNLSLKYGPIMSIRLGNVETVVLSSPDSARLFLGTHDANFSSRPQIQASEHLSYGAKGMAYTPYGPYWRSMRKLCTVELLSVAKINDSRGMRREEIGVIMKEIGECVTRNEVVNLSETVGRLIENMTFRMLFGRTGYEGADFRSLANEGSEVIGAFNLGDYVPMLAPLDLQGSTRRIKSLSKKYDEMIESLINKREQDRSLQGLIQWILLIYYCHNSDKPNDPSHGIDRKGTKAILLDMIVGAIDASTTSTEWVLSLLIKHPRVMKKLQQELSDVVGNKREVDETHLTKLSYLHMVIKETFRLYPAAPLLVPRESINDIVINGYHIPKKTLVLVNFWAFGRDSKVWSKNCNEFLPERFLDKDVDFRGHDFELIPFGTGRRGCPGMNLGLINVGLIVSQLVHSFNWDLPSGMSPVELDMTEKFGLSMPRAKPLVAIPTYRLYE